MPWVGVGSAFGNWCNVFPSRALEEMSPNLAISFQLVQHLSFLCLIFHLSIRPCLGFRAFLCALHHPPTFPVLSSPPLSRFLAALQSPEMHTEARLTEQVERGAGLGTKLASHLLHTLPVVRNGLRGSAGGGCVSGVGHMWCQLHNHYWTHSLMYLLSSLPLATLQMW
jgi:hypothetical protein